MDYDDRRLSLADKFSGSNSDENEIDSDLEDQLYAAVFHCNDVSHKNQDIPGNNNFTSLTNVTDSWNQLPNERNTILRTGKIFSQYVDAQQPLINVPDKSKTRKNRNTILHTTQSSDKNIIINSSTSDANNSESFHKQVSFTNKNSLVFEDEPTVRNSSPQNLSKYSEHRNCLEKISIEFGGNSSRNEINLQNTDSVLQGAETLPYKVCDDEKLTIDIYSEETINVDLCKNIEIVSEVKDSRRNILTTENKSPQANIMKTPKISPKKSLKSKKLPAENSPSKFSKQADTVNEADNWVAASDARSNSTGDPNESLNAKPEEKSEKVQLVENEPKVCSGGDSTHATEGEPATIKPEDESAEAQSIESEVMVKELDGSTSIKPEEQSEQIQHSENSVSQDSSSSSSSTDSSSSDNTTNCSNEDPTKKKIEEDLNETLELGTECSDVITIEDSEGSICEVPVPPKPKPPTINLEDSDSSISSSSDTDSEDMSAQQLVKNYKMAVSESGFRNQQKGQANIDVTQKKKSGTSAELHSSSTSSSDSDDSMTESEEENWGIIAGRQTHKDKTIQNYRAGIMISDIIDDSTNDVPQESTDHLITEDRHKSIAVEPNEHAILVTESRREIENVKRAKQSSENSSANHSFELEKHLDEVPKIQSVVGQRILENNEKEKNSQSAKNVVEDNALIINVAEPKSVHSLNTLEVDEELEIPVKTPESRKRSTTDNRQKSKHHSSPKKSKSSDNTVETTSSDVRFLKANKENKEQRRNYAADYFFKPMTNEMKDYYNKSWGGENFDVDAMRRKMPRDPRHWSILNEDLLTYQQQKSRYWTQNKCRNCHRTDHRTTECPEKKKIPCCHMCGASGHREPRCPYTMCLGCGKKQKTYVQVCNGCRRAWCNSCQSSGHIEDNCPDLWRRYHLTTSFGDMKMHLKKEDVMKPQHLLSCCNCAKRGHDSTTCNNYRWSRHFPTPAYVTNYTKGPAYAVHRILENEDLTIDLTNATETEKRHTDTTVSCKKSSTRERRKETNKATNENLMLLDDKNVEKTEGQLKDKSGSCQARGQYSNEPLQTNSKTKKHEESLLTLKSKLLDNSFMQVANFGEHEVPLSIGQYESLVDSSLSREFLKNLTSQVPANLDIKHSPSEEKIMVIASTKDLHFPIQQIIMDWLKWPIDERSRFVNFNLPMVKKDLVKLLTSKLNELKQKLGDPVQLFQKVQALKNKLHSIQRQRKSGKKVVSDYKRARIVEELANSQCRLNMILVGQLKSKNSEKSWKYLKNALIEMQRIDSPTYVCASMYLQIVHHYNKIFTAYTIANVKNLLRAYSAKHKKSKSSKRKLPKEKNTKNRSQNVTHSDCNNSQGAKRNRDTDPLVASPDFCFNVHNQSLSQVMINNRECSSTVANKNSNYNTEGHFQVWNRDSNNKSFNYDSNISQYRTSPPRPLMADFNWQERNYYHSQYDFGDNFYSQSQGARRVQQNNYQVDNYIAFDNQSSQNSYHSRQGTCNDDGIDLLRKSGTYYQTENIQKNHMRDVIENRPINSSRLNSQSNFSFESNRLQASYNQPDNIFSEDLFFSDNKATSFQDFQYTNTNILSKIEDDARSSHNVHNSLSSVVQNPLTTAAHDNLQSGKKQHKNNNKRKKNKKKEPNLSDEIVKRAEINIRRFKNSEVPGLKDATMRLEQKMHDKSLKIRHINKYEKFVKSKLFLKQNDML